MSAWILVGIVIGMFVGKELEAMRWRGNAKRIQRIESAGKLFKVKKAR